MQACGHIVGGKKPQPTFDVIQRADSDGAAGATTTRLMHPVYTFELERTCAQHTCTSTLM